MSVEQKIVEASEEKIKALILRAAKAVKNPETGIKILVPGAKFVIRDCAQITVDYLPLKLYGGIKDPTEKLKGVFTKKEIKYFVKRATENCATKHLCNIMLLDARGKVHITPEEVEEELNEKNNDDIYGDYGSDSYVEKESTENVDFEDGKQIIDVLCNAFEVK